MDINLLAEKKSLIRFLIIYIFSTFILLGVGEWFYYKLSKESIIKENRIILAQKVDRFLKERVRIRSMRNIHLLDNMAIYKGEYLIASNFNPPKLNFDKEVQIIGNKIFYIKKLIRPFGIIYVVTFKQYHNNLIDKLIIFNIFAFIFIVFIAFILGKIFLAPMKQTIQKLEDFITDATHEMNTPISIIMSNIEILEMKGIENKELNRIKTASKRLSKIFDDLKFVRLNHNTKKEIQNINLKEFLLDRIKYFEIEAKLNLKDVFIKIDKEDLTRLIDNLLSNAKKYSNEFIEIDLNNEYLSIKNDGEIKNIKNITKKYVRENKNEGGFGIGLYIVDKICKSYGFKFSINNESKYVIVNIFF